MGDIGSPTTDNNWYCQSFFADTDFINLYLCAILVTLFIGMGQSLKFLLLSYHFRNKEFCPVL